jgi:tRNA A-37 threonylcarbamoyl transferase component Bud32
MGRRAFVTSTAALPPHVGTLLGGRYELVRHIARGGMGDVYEADDQVLERRVAVKLYRAASPADRSRFDAEVRVLAGLNHPGLVRVYDAGPHGDDAFVVLELIEGPPLSKMLGERGPMSPTEVARLGAKLAESLAYIHERGVVHRDVTPSNVLCDAAGHARLVDFGIARLLESPRVTNTSLAVGTAAYMAPEQVLGEDVTPAADVYALGLLLLEALTGRRAFAGSMQEVATARLVRSPDTETDVPRAWQELLAAMVAREPSERPDAAGVHAALTSLTIADEVTAAVPIPALRAPIGNASDEDATQAMTAAIAMGDATAMMPIPVPSATTAPIAVPPRYERRQGIPGWGIWAAGLGVAAIVLIVAFVAMGSPDSGLPATSTTVAKAADAPVTVASTTPKATSTTAATTTTVEDTTTTSLGPVISLPTTPSSVDTTPTTEAPPPSP